MSVTLGRMMSGAPVGARGGLRGGVYIHRVLKPIGKAEALNQRMAALSPLTTEHRSSFSIYFPTILHVESSAFVDPRQVCAANVHVGLS